MVQLLLVRVLGDVGARVLPLILGNVLGAHSAFIWPGAILRVSLRLIAVYPQKSGGNWLKKALLVSCLSLPETKMASNWNADRIKIPTIKCSS